MRTPPPQPDSPGRLRLFALACTLLCHCAGNGVLSGGGSAAPPTGTSYGGNDPGSKVLQRLDHRAYNNTVRDLLGTTQTPGNDFPQDEMYLNFDNVGTVLSTSPSLVQSVFAAAVALGEEIQTAATDPARQAQYFNIAPCAKGPNTTTCVADVVKNFGLKAWRRPLTDSEASEITAIAQGAGSDLPTQVGTAVAALLSSPNFFFRVEIDPAPHSSTPHALNSFELATRLSYFLWRSTPDAALLASAASGALLQDGELTAQVQRMLNDKRADTLVNEFADRWLLIDQVGTLTPDAKAFPDFNDTVRASMQAETQQFLSDFFTKGTPLSELVQGSYSYIDDTMAAWYGVSTTPSQTPVRVALPPGSGRRGVLSQGTVLLAGSSGIATSPIHRGKMILSQLLCSSPPPPPPNVPTLDTSAASGGTMRSMLEQHVSNPACSSCHVVMDSLGFAFEGFDAVGKQRTKDNNLPIDTRGVYVDNKSFQSNVDLSDMIAADDRFSHCATEMLFVYGLGRPTTPADAPILTGLDAKFKNAKLDMRQLIIAVVTSLPFRSRHALAED